MRLIQRLYRLGNRVLSALLGTVAAVLVLYGSFVLYDSFYTQSKAVADTQDLLQYRPTIIDEEETPLAGAMLTESLGDDYRAWLIVYQTGIDYPVLQGPDDLYYASHDAHGEVSLTGAIYLSAINSGDFSDRYNMIYGHHMDNGAMFGTLDAFRDESFFRSHSTGAIAAGGVAYDLKLFAVVDTDAYNESVYEVGNRNLDALIGTIETLASLYDAETAAAANKVVALSTCAGSSTNGRLIVFFSMTPRAAQPAPDPIDEDPIEVIGEIDEDPVMPAIEPPIGDAPVPAVDEGFADIDEPAVPLAAFMPKGSRADGESWAVLNLLLMLVCVYLCLPVLRLRDKFSRVRLAHESRYTKRFSVGFALELLLAAGAVALFLMTADLRQPMTLIDKWTPVLLLAAAVSLALDTFVLRRKPTVQPA